MPLGHWGTITKRKEENINCVELTKYWGLFYIDSCWPSNLKGWRATPSSYIVNTTTDLRERLKWVSNPSNEISGARTQLRQHKSWGGSGCHLDLTERICIFSRSHLKYPPPPLLTPPCSLTLAFLDIFSPDKDNETLTVWWLPILFCQVSSVENWSVCLYNSTFCHRDFI